MFQSRIPVQLFGALALLFASSWVGCQDKEACRPYVAEVKAVAGRAKGKTQQAYARRLRDQVAAVATKYRKLEKQCHRRASAALGKLLVSRCVKAPSFKRPSSCPSGWSKKRCCQLDVFCLFRYPTSADYCTWEPKPRPRTTTLPRCTTCPGCVPEGSSPSAPQNVSLWLGGDGETLAVVLDRPVNDSWLLPRGAPPDHLEDMLYSLWKQPGYLAPNAAIVRGETVSVDGWNTLEQALHQGGWGRLGLNLSQWQGKLHCAAVPPKQRYTFPPGQRTVSVAITDGVLWLDAKQLLLLDKGRVSPSDLARDRTGLIIAPLFNRLKAQQRAGKQPDVLRIAIHRGLTVPSRLVASIIYTSTQVLRGTHARITCQEKGAVR